MKKIVFVFTALIIVIGFVGADKKEVLAPFDYGKVAVSGGGACVSGIGNNVVVMGVAVDTSDCTVGNTTGFWYTRYKQITQTHFARYRIYSDADTYIMSVNYRKGNTYGKPKLVVDGDSIATLNQYGMIGTENAIWNINVTFASAGEHTIDFVELNQGPCYIGMFWLRKGIYP